MSRRPNKPLWPYVLNCDSDQAQGLVGWWPGGPHGGPRLFDMSGRGNHGTINGTIPATGIWTPGKDSGKGALTLDGSTNYVDFGNAISLQPPTAVSMSAWIKPVSVSPGAQMVISKQSGSPYYGYQIGLLSNKLFAEIAYNVNAATSQSVSTLTAGVWTHISATYDGANIRLYINGSLDKTSAATGALTYTSNVDLVLGQYTGNVDRYGGIIDDPRVYARTISGADVAAMFAPATRWQLRYQPGRKMWSFGPSTSIVTCVGASSFSFTAAATGASKLAGVGASSFNFTVAATGTSTLAGGGASSFSFTVSGTGASTLAGAGASSFNFAVAGTGASTLAGVGASSFNFTSAGTGISLFAGIGASSFNFTSTATGALLSSGVGASSFNFTSAATGALLSSGTGSSSFNFTVAGGGASTAVVSGAGSASFLFTASATGVSTAASVGTSSFYFTALGFSQGQIGPPCPYRPSMPDDVSFYSGSVDQTDVYAGKRDECV